MMMDIINTGMIIGNSKIIKGKQIKKRMNSIIIYTPSL